MCGLMLGLLLPHGDAISWSGYAYNLGLSTVGNIIGGAFFVGGLYWIGSPKARSPQEPQIVIRPSSDHPPSTNGTAVHEPATALR
jgi:hypothetical protein